MLRLVSVAFVCGSLTIGCGPGSPPPDAAISDVGIDVGNDAAVRDSGRCATECMTGRACCPSPEGDMCLDLSNDVANCGACGRDCVAMRRGDLCIDYQCACGSAEVGCTGTATSICCPPTEPGGEGYCANLGRDPTDCGVCGFECDRDRASQCEGGNCTCGLSGEQCAGTPEDMCCTRDAEEPSCVDTTTAMDHCGRCGVRCNASERCMAGVCTSVLPDAGVDAAVIDAGVDASEPDAGTDAG